MKRKVRVYVAGLLNAMTVDYLENCHAMILTAERLRGYGFSVYVPCLDIVHGLVVGGLTYTDYFENSQPWLMAADAVFLCKGWESSSGCLKEVELAAKLSIPAYFNIGNILAHFGHYDTKKHTYIVPERNFPE